MCAGGVGDSILYFLSWKKRKMDLKRWWKMGFLLFACNKIHEREMSRRIYDPVHLSASKHHSFYYNSSSKTVFILQTQLGNSIGTSLKTDKVELGFITLKGRLLHYLLGEVSWSLYFVFLSFWLPTGQIPINEVPNKWLFLFKRRVHLGPVWRR